ncbi:MAG TPA: plastocyanin/azurin family copper-binding protein [Acidimicrobiia bacterium]
MVTYSYSRSLRSWGALLALGIAVILVTGCGDDTGSGATSLDEENHEEEFNFGEPADAADADRTIDIDANNDLTFDPASITISEGETITFRVTNTGNLEHDFVLGDEDAQEAHEAEMMEMMESGEEMEHSDPYAVSVPAGETVELTWHFTEPGTVLFGCHEPGHYEAGMKGTISVES